MGAWVAFIRGINVGGNKIVPMKALAEKCTAMGLRDVRTYIASGNLLFEARGAKVAAHERLIEKCILDAFEHDVKVLVRTRAELEALAATRPFGAAHGEADAKLYVAFLSAEPTLAPKLPQHFPKEGVELLGTGERMAFYVARPLSGKQVVPAVPLEKIFGVQAVTVRNWNTICKMLEPRK